MHSWAGPLFRLEDEHLATVARDASGWDSGIRALRETRGEQVKGQEGPQLRRALGPQQRVDRAPGQPVPREHLDESPGPERRGQLLEQAGRRARALDVASGWLPG